MKKKKQDKINYFFANNKLTIELPLEGRGRARFKTRNSIYEFGKSYAPSTIPMEDNNYVEWQISYDIPVNETDETTKCIRQIFGIKKKKYLYELSVFLWILSLNKVITKEELLSLKEKIEKSNQLLMDDYQIIFKKPKKIKIAGQELLSSELTLPAFFKTYKNTPMNIEIAIQKQQNASSVQPMLYLSVPIQAFANYKDIVNNTTQKTKYGCLIFDENNKNIILDMFHLFGLCSLRHKHDILQILKITIKNIN